MGAPELQAVDAFRLVDRLFADFFAPRPEQSIEEWADGKLMLPKEMASEPGPMRLDRTPYLRQVLRDLWDVGTEEIVLMFGTQLGKTTALLAKLGYVVDYAPAPVMYVMPTVDVALKFSKQRVAPLVAANECLRSKIAEVRSRDGGNTTLVKSFTGGILVITGANSAAGLASMPAKVVLFDEVDDYPLDAGGQGDPMKIANARQDTFPRRKRIKASTPKKAKTLSAIERDFERGARFRYFVACPDCGHRQVLRWSQLKWVKEPEPRPETAAYACEACGVLWPEHCKPALLAGGEWRAENPGAAVRSYHLSSLYSPLGWLSWSSLVEEWLDATAEADKGRPEPLRTFINLRLAETWEEEAQRLAANELQAMAEPFPLKVVPREGLLLVAFVDVQDNRFEIGVWAAGEGGDELYTVDHLVIPANPGLASDWVKVDAALRTRYPHALGGTLAIEAAGIDTGGHFTHDVYRYVRRVPSARRVAATKGADRPTLTTILGKSTSVDVNVHGGVIKHGVKLWFVGVNVAKDLLFARLRAKRVHMSAELPAEWFEQLAAEHRIPVRTARGERYVWVKKPGATRNEALDCAVGALWCLERLGVAKWPRKYWEVLKQQVAPKRDLFGAQGGDEGQAPAAAEDAASAHGESEQAAAAPPRPVVQTPAKPAKPARPPRRPGFVNGWKR